MADREVAEATPPEDRTRAQWALLGWPFGPPVMEKYANETPLEVFSLTPAEAYAYGWNACLHKLWPEPTEPNRELAPDVCDD